MNPRSHTRLPTQLTNAILRTHVHTYIQSSIQPSAWCGLTIDRSRRVQSTVVASAMYRAASAGMGVCCSAVGSLWLLLCYASRSSISIPANRTWAYRYWTPTGLLLDSCWASVGLGPTTGLGPQQCLVSGHSERPAAIAPVSRTGVRIVSGNYSRDTEY